MKIINTGLIVLVIWVALIGGCGSLVQGKVMTDSQGRYTFQAAESLIELVTSGDYFHFREEKSGIDAYVVAQGADDEEQGLKGAFMQLGLDPQALVENGSNAMGEWKLKKYLVPATGTSLAAAFQYRGTTCYAVIVKPHEPGTDASAPPASIMGIVRSFKFMPKAGSVFLPGDRSELEEYIKATAAKFQASISVAVLEEGALTYTFAAGNRDRGLSADTGTAYYWGSITKIMTATAVMQLLDQGRLDLDTTLDTYIPELVPGKQIPLRLLLCHASGLPDLEVRHLIGMNDVPLPSLEEALVAYLPRAGKLSFQPGSRYAYNNWNYLLLGIIVERLSGLSLPAYIERYILEPVDMNNSAFLARELEVPLARPIVKPATWQGFRHILEEQGLTWQNYLLDESRDHVYLRNVDILSAWGGLKGTPGDAVRFGWMFLNQGLAKGKRILAASSVKAMQTPQLSPGNSHTESAVSMGLGWRLGEDGRGRFMEHGGGGPGLESLLRVYPQKKLAIAVMGNTSGYNPTKILDFTLSVVLGSDLVFYLQNTIHPFVRSKT